MTASSEVTQQTDSRHYFPVAEKFAESLMLTPRNPVDSAPRTLLGAPLGGNCVATNGALSFAHQRMRQFRRLLASPVQLLLFSILAVCGSSLGMSLTVL
jgi:hypothetical protein